VIFVGTQGTCFGGDTPLINGGRTVNDRRAGG